MISLVAKRKGHLKLIICGCLLFFVPIHAEAQRAKFTDLLITNNAGKMLVYAQVTNCFTTKMEDAILAGIPTTFTFLIDLYQEIPFWWDKRIVRQLIQHTVKYDNVEKNFHVFSTNGQESATFQTFDDAKRAMADLNGVPVFQVSALAMDKSYYLKMKAKLDQAHLPLHMEYLLFFVSLWDFETDWHIQKVTHQNVKTP